MTILFMSLYIEDSSFLYLIFNSLKVKKKIIFCLPLILFKISVLINLFQEYHQRVKQFGPR